MKIKDGYLLRNIADEWIIVPIGERIYDFNGLMTVNETGAFLWKMLQEDCTEDKLICEIMNEYNVDNSVAKEDVSEFIKSLIKGGVIKNE
jgi:hypothetical protein